jgi:phage/plasmid-like protein (TIGR03299 family)
MAHRLNIDEKTGKARMFYIKAEGKPWHGLGTELQGQATAKEAIEAAKLDYTVEKCPLIATVPEKGKPVQVNVPGRYVAAVRTDTKDVLGIVGDGYKVVQNVEAFDFFDTVVGEGQAIYNSAGALDNGSRIWLMAKLPKDMVIAREDIVEKYLILANSHDGTSALKLFFSPVRVVCHNTLTEALKDAKGGISIRHSGDITGKTNEARKVLGISIKWYNEFEELCKQLVKVQMTKGKAEGYFDKMLYGETIDEKKEESMVLKNRKDDYMYLFEHGKGNDLPSVKGSAWCALNAITEYHDHYKVIKNETEDPTNRLKSIWFGNAAHIKGKAFEGILQVAGIKQ